MSSFAPPQRLASLWGILGTTGPGSWGTPRGQAAGHSLVTPRQHTVGAGPRQGHLCPGGPCYTPQRAGWSPPSGLLAGDTTLAQHCFSDPEMARDQAVSSGGDQGVGAHVWTAGLQLNTGSATGRQRL